VNAFNLLGKGVLLKPTCESKVKIEGFGCAFRHLNWTEDSPEQCSGKLAITAKPARSHIDPASIL